jgi:hypothetical protein
MASAAQIAANRENGKKSQGPTSDEGKQASSRNNLRHGLTGHVFALMTWEKPEHFDLFHAALKQEYNPTTATELILVEKMAQQQWLAQRAQSFLTVEMSIEIDDPEIQHECQKKYQHLLALPDPARASVSACPE